MVRWVGGDFFAVLINGNYFFTKARTNNQSLSGFLMIGGHESQWNQRFYAHQQHEQNKNSKL